MAGRQAPITGRFCAPTDTERPAPPGGQVLVEFGCDPADLGGVDLPAAELLDDLWRLSWLLTRWTSISATIRVMARSPRTLRSRLLRKNGESRGDFALDGRKIRLLSEKSPGFTIGEFRWDRQISGLFGSFAPRETSRTGPPARLWATHPLPGRIDSRLTECDR